MQSKKTDRKKKRVIAKQSRTKTSIVCGTENPASLGCDFYELEDGELATVFTPKEIHEGHDGIMHGGLSGAILDEVMGRCNFVEAADGTLYNPYVTGEMTVRYYLPIRVGTKMRAFGRVDRSEGRKNFNSGEILDAAGVVVAEAAGIYIRTNFIDDQNVPEGGKAGDSATDRRRPDGVLSFPGEKAENAGKNQKKNIDIDKALFYN